MTQEALPEGAEAETTGGERLISDGKVMSIWDHLSELRGRLVRSALAVVVFFGIALAFSQQIILFLRQPLQDALPPGADVLHFTNPLDVFMIDLKVGFLVGIVASAPVWIYQFWKFFEPALYPRERRYVLPFIVASAGLFFVGIAFCYFVILPSSLDFLIGMGREVGTPMITIRDYVSLLFLMIFSFGLVFEAPVIIVLLAFLDILSLEGLKAARRYVVVGTIIVSAFMAPPDPVSQVAMSVPLYGMYEVSILLIRLLKRKKKTTTETDAP